MSVCVLSESQKNNEQKALTTIEKAVKDNDAGALTNILDEVNNSRMNDKKFCVNNTTLDSKLSTEAKEATNLKEVPDPFTKGRGQTYLEIEPLWVAEHTQRADR